MNGACIGTFFDPDPWGHGEGPKGQIALNFNYKVNFKDFLNQTLCVFSEMKDIKHIRQNSFSRRDGDLETWKRGKTIQIQPDLVCELLTCT